jgi:putative hemolysin
MDQADRIDRINARALETTHEVSAHAEPRLALALARTQADIEDAQRLRYKVFGEEMGANINSSDNALDRDEFDPWCDHLLVRDLDTLRVVGTYRILPPHRALGLGRLYSDAEFDLSRLAHLRPTAIEVGRSCVHRDYRSGGTILMLWAGLAKYMKAGGYRHLIGCASASLSDGGQRAARLRDEMHRYMTDAELRVFPRLPFPHARFERAAACAMPPLIKGYLRVGARVCGEPAWDPDFNTADFLLWLSLERLSARYARHFDLLAGETAAVIC